MSITFNDQYVTAKGISYYDASAVSYTQRGSTNNPYNCDLFPDTGVAVGDAILFANHSDTCGKYNELAINLDVAISATGFDGVWEYCVGGTNAAPGWSALSVVSDGTNKLQNTGAQILSFDVPSDWDNFHLTQVGSYVYYAFLIRFRITSLTTLTEGGHVVNTSNSVQMKNYCINIDNAISSPVTFTDIYNADVAGGWGVVTNVQKMFSFACNLKFTNGGLLTSTQELIQFERNWQILSPPFQFNIGELVSGDKVRKGSTLLFLGRNINYNSGYIFKALSKVYNATIKHYAESGTGFNFNGYWGAGLGSQSGQKVIDLSLEGFRQINLPETSNTIIGSKFFGFTGVGDSHAEPLGAIVKGCKWFGGTYAVRTGSTSGTYLHESDISGVTYPINVWEAQGVNNHRTYIIDCYFGTVADTNKVRWQISSTVTYQNTEVYEGCSFLTRVVDKNGTAISGATILIKDINGSTVYTLTSNDDGYFGVDSGTVTSSVTDSISDSSKSWTTSQWRFSEVYITSGTGVGQRRIITIGNTATQITAGWGWDTLPTAGAKFIFIPNIHYKKFVPIAYTPSSSQNSTVTDYNPYTIIISKSGYKTIRKKVTVNGKIDWTVTMDKVLVNNIDGVVQNWQ